MDDEKSLDELSLTANEIFNYTNNFYNDLKNDFPISCVKNDSKIVYVDALYEKNIELIKGCIALNKSDNVTSIAALLRIILEGIITIFYLVLKETDIINYETKIKHNFHNSPKSKDVKQIIQKYTANSMIKTLYVKNNLEIVQEIYNVFNSSIHNDYRTHIKYPTDAVKSNLFGIIPSLNLLNTFAMVQAYMGTTKEKDVVKFAGAYIPSLMMIIGDKFAVLIPNNQIIFEKLLFKESIRRHVDFI